MSTTTTQTRSLTSATGQPDTEGARHLAVVQKDMVVRAALFKGQLEQELAAALAQSGFNTADQSTARTTIIAAVKAVLW